MRLGPGAMVAAAFIGPGTVTTAAAAGMTTGVGLLWAVMFSVVATLVLQELSLRSALVTQRDLASLMRSLGERHWWQLPFMILIVLAIGVGNAAYQSGNLSGAGLGLSAAFDLTMTSVVSLSALIAGTLIYLDRYKLVEQVLVAIVAVMALLFCGLAIALLPNLLAQPASIWLPNLSQQHLTTTLALIGTTVVPYNLFLHATAVRKRWSATPLPQALREARLESALSILIGGLITTAIVIIAASASASIEDKGVILGLMATVENALPGWGSIAVGCGLFAAGITSSITAPLAAGWAVSGALGKMSSERDVSKWVALGVLAIGCLFALVTTRPTALIISAQATNALLLPIIAIALLFVARSQTLLGNARNRPLTNAVTVLIVIMVSGLALRKLIALW